MPVLYRKIIIIALGSILLLVVGQKASNYFASQKKEIPTKPLTTAKKYIQTQAVTYSEQQALISGFGRVNSSARVALSSEVGGKMLSGDVILKPGISFNRGQLLFSIYNQDVLLALKARKSNFMNRLALLMPDLKYDFPDRYPVWEAYFEAIDIDKPLASLPDFSSTREKTYMAANNIISEYYSILSDEERLRKYRIYAPFKGTISEVFFEPGSVVNPGTRVADIVRSGSLELVLPVNASALPYLKEGMAANIEEPGSGKSWKGKINRIGDVVDARTQSVNLYIDINPDSRNALFEGEYLKAVIEGKSIGKAMALPRKAFVKDNSVYTLQRDSSLLLKEVTRIYEDENTGYLTGLEEGEVVVSESLTSIREGVKFISLEKE